MVRLMRVLSVIACTGAMTVPCLAASSPWDGTWKLDAAKSKMTGETVTVIDNHGRYEVDNGTVKFSYACDGKEYPLIADRTVRCKETASTMDSVVSANGKELYTLHDVLSGNGRTWTETETERRPDGTIFTEEDVFDRTAGGPGFAGSWKNTVTKEHGAESMTMQVSDGMLHLTVPAFQESFAVKIGGAPAVIHGPTIPAGLTVSAGMEGGKIETSVMLNGKVLRKRLDSLSADGQVLTQVSWSPAKPGEREIFTYEKQ